MFKMVQINSTTAKDDSLRKLYESSFPKEESIPYDEIIQVLDLMDVDYTAYYEGDKLLALSIISRFPRFNFGNYFAVQKELRGKGHGQKILNIILDKYKKGNPNPIIIDIESPLQEDAPNLNIRKRRHDFYIRNGWRDTGVYYTYNGVSLSVMSNSQEPFTQKDYDEIDSLLLPILDKAKKNNDGI